MFKIIGKMMDQINIKTEIEWQKGRKKLEKIGRVAYDKKARRRYGYIPPLREE